MLAVVFLSAYALMGTEAYAQSTGSSSGSGGSIMDFVNWVQGERDPTEVNTPMSYQEWKEYFAGGPCWGCQLFQKMADVTVEMGQRGSAAFKGPATSAVSSFMGLWVMFQLYRMLSVSHANSPVQSIDEIFNRLVWMMVVLFVLHSNPFTLIMQEGVLPAMGGLMSGAGSILSAPGTCDGGGSSAFVQQGSKLLCAMHHQMGAGVGMGAWLAAEAKFDIWPGGQIEVVRFAGGVLLMLIFGAMWVLLPLRFFDALVRIATVSVILPIVVLASLFKPTRGAVKQALTSLLAAALTFLFTAIAIAIAINLLDSVAKDIFEFNYGDQESRGIGPLSGSQFMILVGAGVGLATMIMQAGNLASEFAGFQGQMGSAGSVVMGSATVAGGAAARYAGGAAMGAPAAAASGARAVGAGASRVGNMLGGGKGGGIKPGDAAH